MTTRDGVAWWVAVVAASAGCGGGASDTDTSGTDAATATSAATDTADPPTTTGPTPIARTVTPRATPAALRGLTVAKRDGRRLPFDDARIYAALEKAFREVHGEPTPVTHRTLTDLVARIDRELVERFPVDVKIYEIQKYVTLAQYRLFSYVTMVSKQTFEGLPPDLQQVVLQADRDALGEYMKLFHAQDAEAVKMAEEKGMTVVRLTPEQREGFKKAAEPVYEQFADQIGRELLRRIREAGRG